MSKVTPLPAPACEEHKTCTRLSQTGPYCHDLGRRTLRSCDVPATHIVRHYLFGEHPRCAVHAREYTNAVALDLTNIIAALDT